MLMNRELLFYLGKLLIFFFLYYVTAKIGLEFDPISGFATLFWLPTGISLALMLLWGYKFWPGIALGAFLANLTADAPLFVAIGIAVGNTLEAFVGAYLLKRFIKFHTTLDRLIDVLGLLVFAGLLSTFISATVGVTSLLLGGIVTYDSYAQTWVGWWVGDMVSNLLIAPLLLVWSTRISFLRKPTQFLEAILWGLAAAVTCVIVFQDLLTKELANSPSTYWLFPPLIWSALRLGQRWTITAIVLVSLVAVWSTVQGTGPFVHNRLSDGLLSLHIFMGVIATTSMILAAVVSERKVLEKRKDNFINIASHELKTPITSSKSYVQVLRKRFQKEKDTKSQSAVYLLTKTDEQLDKLTILINDLLDLSKIQSGKLVLRQKKFDIDTFVAGNIDSFQQATKTHDIKGEGKVKKKITGDEYRLGQVLTNFLTNAVKYSPKADKVIVKLTSDKKMVTVSVQDFGMGMSVEAQKKIFEPFFQIDGVKREGLGLGLHIASEIVRGHGGTISVISKKAKGSTFSFSLPLK